MEQPKSGRPRDLTGQRFGRLVALAPTEKRADGGSVVWLCQCDCGKRKEVSARRLARGKVRSCGCLSDPPPKDYVGRRFGRLVVTAYAGRERRRTERSRATVTLWRCRCDCGREVTVPQPELQSGASQSCGCLQKERTREALALVEDTSATLLERVHTGPPRKNNTSGHTGVFRRKDGRWLAYINFQKKRYYLGCFASKEEAVKAREKGEEMHEDFLAWYHALHPPAPAEAEAEKKP